MGLNNFTDTIQDGNFGRKVIYTTVSEITSANVVEVLNKAIAIHRFNELQIKYLENYYTGNQPILQRIKDVRPTINNKIVENHAYEIVEFMTAQNFGEPIQYANRNTLDSKAIEIDKLNTYMFSEDKGEIDIQIGRWQNICGTAYRLIYNDSSVTAEMDECPFGMEALSPKDAFVIYSSKVGKKPMMGVCRTYSEDNKETYCCYTQSEYFEIVGGEITNPSINGIGLIPIIEYPKNDRRIGAIEIVLPLLDSINMIQSNRIDGIEQFIQAFLLFVNCQIDETTFIGMAKLGALTVKGEQGLPADVKSISSQLDQLQTQTAKDDLYNNVLIIEGMPDRKSENSGGDTGSAVYLRNGFIFSNLRAEINEHAIQKSEKAFLRVALKILNTRGFIDLKLSDIEVKIMRSHIDNILVKAQALRSLLDCGIDGEIAVKIINLFSDPENVWIRSKENIESMFGKDAIDKTQQSSASQNLQAIE